ncbi:hypothetical protein [Pseudoalteromonas gelatinilytica]
MMKNDVLNSHKLGNKFYFQDGDNQIACFGHIMSGKEKIYVNDELVSEKRSFGFKSNHDFNYQGNAYAVKFEMQNILTGKVECSFYKAGKLVKQSTQTSLTDNPKQVALVTLGCFLGGAISGYAVVTFIEPFLGK